MEETCHNYRLNLDKRRAQGILLGILLLLAVSSCANATAASQPTTLQATRIVNAFFHPMPPFQRTIGDAAAVQRLYTAALGLAKVQPGVYNCTDGPVVQYQLRFLQNGTLVSEMNFKTSDCQWLRIGASDSRWTTPAFQTLLAQTLGLSKLT